MFSIDTKKGHGVVMHGTRIAKDVTEDKKIFEQHYVRIGQLEKAYDIDLSNVEWLCEIKINSIKQADGYARMFREIADALIEQEIKNGTAVLDFKLEEDSNGDD